MYSSFSGSIEGFTKNFYPGFSTTKIVFSFMLLFFFVSYFLPIVLSFFDILFIISLLLIIVNRAGVALVSRQSVLWAILLHPVQMLIMMYIGIRSMVFSGKGKVTWKGRTL
jgi:chlorobactene glucosyltransferase